MDIQQILQQFFIEYQIRLLNLLGFFCLVLTLFVCLVRFSSRRRKVAMLQIEFFTGVMLMSDMFAYYFRGNTTSEGWWGIRIANFLLFVSIYAIIYGFNNYIVSLLMGKDKLKKLPVRLLLGYILSGVGMTIVTISQFTHWLYRIDENNMYHRGPLITIGFILPAIILFIQLTVIIQHFKLFSPGVFISLLFYILMPVAAAYLQAISTGISSMNIAIGFSAIVLYMFSIVEQNHYMHSAFITDLPTGLPNTQGYLIEIDKKVANHTIKDYCSIYFDINRMGMFNRKYGNDVGDAVIKAYAKEIDSHLEKSEVLGRLGGNFFIALIKQKNKNAFLELLKETSVSVKIGKKYTLLKISATAGGFEPTHNRVTPEHMIGYAAQALNYAKNVVKKPYVAMTSELLAQVERDRQVEAQIPQAIEDKEFVPFYQPKVDSETNLVCGAEALVRWVHEGSTVPPIQFIPIMERNDSICTLDFYMLNAVCKDIKVWLDRGMQPPVVSVNFSRRNLGNPKFINDVYNTIKRNEVPLKYIQVEVTETIDEYPISVLRGVVAGLQQLGISVAIDDFGVGSSSISLLKEMSFDVIKIDKKFIDYENKRDITLLRFIVEIAKAIDAEVVAEGVELQEQINMLKEMGCRIIQGYFYSKPIPKSEFESFLLEHREKTEEAVQEINPENA